jgi:tellurite methyltransferase
VGEGDRERWNAVWREKAGEMAPPAAFLREYEELLPRTGKALDIAGGAGRHAVWLARRGLDVTMIDVSDVGLERAERRAGEVGVSLRLLRLDLETAELPIGPYDLILCFHYLDRVRRGEWIERLNDSGVIVMAQPTKVNLERHAKPSERFLVEPGELEAWAREVGLEILVSQEGWNLEDRHEAELIARRRAAPKAKTPPRPKPGGASGGPYR